MIGVFLMYFMGDDLLTGQALGMGMNFDGCSEAALYVQ